MCTMMTVLYKKQQCVCCGCRKPNLQLLYRHFWERYKKTPPIKQSLWQWLKQFLELAASYFRKELVGLVYLTIG